MKKISLIILMFWFIAINSLSFAQEKDSLQNIETVKTWDRFSVNLGGFIAGVNTGVRFGSEQLGLGIDIKLEDALGMEISNFVFRGDAMYRFGKSKRHSVKMGYFSFIRSAYKVLEAEIEIGDHVFPIGTEIDSRFDLSILNISYDYSFFNDERINLGASIGLFIMPIKFEVGIAGNIDEATDFVAPLPVFGLRSDFAITPKLYLKQNIDILYLQIDEFTGSIVDINIRLEHNTWKHFGFGIGLNMYKLRIEANGEQYPQIHMVGNIEIGYTGLLFYGKYYF